MYADGTNEWISGVNSDVGEKSQKKKKVGDKGGKDKKKPAKVE